MIPCPYIVKESKHLLLTVEFAWVCLLILSTLISSLVSSLLKDPQAIEEKIKLWVMQETSVRDYQVSYYYLVSGQD